MPYSTQMEQQLREVMKVQLKMASFDEPKDFDLFCDLLAQVMDEKKVTYDETNIKFQETIDEIRDVLVDGFDIYAGEEIIDKESRVQISTEASSQWVSIKAFIPDEKLQSQYRDGLVAQARQEFKNVMRGAIQDHIQSLQSLNPESRLKIIAYQKEKKVRVVAEQKKLNEFKGPEPGSEGHVLTEAEWLAQMEAKFGNEIHIISNPNLIMMDIFEGLALQYPATQSEEDAPEPEDLHVNPLPELTDDPLSDPTHVVLDTSSEIVEEKPQGESKSEKKEEPVDLSLFNSFAMFYPRNNRGGGNSNSNDNKPSSGL